jgi:Fe-S cluster assembly protein SufD
MVSAQNSNPYLANYPAHAPLLAGQGLPWLQAYRQSGLQAFAEKGFPSLRDEDWRYTNLAALDKTCFTPSDSQQVDSDWLSSHYLKQAWNVVLLNGRFSPELSRLEGLESGLAIISMALALQETPSSVHDFLGQALSEQAHSLTAFNNAWFQDGVLIHLTAGLQLDKPIHILHVVTAENALAATRQIWVLEPYSQAEIVETYVGSAGSYFTAAINEVFLAEHAELNLTKVQMEADKAVHFGGSYVKQAAKSRFNQHNFAFGSVLARSEIQSDLDEAAECTLNGLYLGRNRQHLDTLTRINHLKPHGISREFYKGVLDQRARGVFQGRVVVAEDAQHTDSQMNNRNLLLSADAEIDTKPQLEIYADDVKCSHGVTVGQLEEKSIFYLQSRGVDETTARNILTFAFANEMVDKLENSELKNLLLSQLLAHFLAINL